MIEFKNVTKKYDNKTTALNDVNISIEKGEFVFVVGSSGAGKSTFLKLMMREEVPSSGTITVDGVDLNKMKKRNIPKFRRKLGIVFQDFRLIPTMTVFDNVAFAMRVIGTKEKKIRRRVPFLLSLMGLSEKSRNYPRELSGGEQQRVALARALANDAEIIIADEPTGNVDPQMSYEIVDLLMRLNEAGTTVIMVTHEHSLVRCFDKRVIILDKGTVISDGNLLDHDAATAHINPASEMAEELRAKSAEDYSVYSPSDKISEDDLVPMEDVFSSSEDMPAQETQDIPVSEAEPVEADVDFDEIEETAAPEFNLPEPDEAPAEEIAEEISAELISDEDFEIDSAEAPEFNLPEPDDIALKEEINGGENDD